MLKEKVVERPTPPWDRFISLMENNVGRFRECSSRKIAFSPRGKFTPLNGKILGKVISLRKTEGERHVYPLRPMFLKGGPVSLGYRMKFTRDNFTSLRGRFFSSKDKISYNFTSLRNLARERHVSPAIPVFLRARPNFPWEEVA